jgi:hypothetical protein
MRELAALLAMICVCAIQTPAGAQASKRTIAIYPLLPLGTDPEIVNTLEDLLYAEITALGSVYLVQRGEVASRSQHAAQAGEACSGAPDCLAQFGRSLGADQVFYGTVATLGGSYVLDVKLVDSSGGTVAGRRSVTLQGEQAVLISGVRELAVQIIDPDQYVGTLDLRVDEPSAQIFLDGVELGTSPLPQVKGLTPGKHTVRVVSAEHPDFERFVDVVFGRTTVVKVTLSEVQASVSTNEPSSTGEPSSTDEPAGAPAFVMPVGIAAVGLGAAALGGGLFSASQLLVPWFEAVSHTKQTDSGQTVVTDQDAYQTQVDRYEDAEDLWWLGIGLSAAGTALVAAGAATLLWYYSAPADADAEATHD